MYCNLFDNRYIFIMVIRVCGYLCYMLLVVGVFVFIGMVVSVFV